MIHLLKVRKGETAIFAIIETGGKQYKVSPGQVIDVELLDVREGDTLTLERVLMYADGDNVTAGQPIVAGAKVVAEVLGEHKGDKLIVFKYKRKVRYRRKRGHTQHYTRLSIKSIDVE